jgi:protein-tyrosine phosphatase
MISVLFVCTGNICRSPTAEGVFRHRLRQAGLDAGVLIDSAGTDGYHAGESPDARATAAARGRGVDISGLRARQVRPTDFREFDLILAMDRSHLASLTRRAPPDAADRIRLFLDFAPQAPRREVPDPYYGGTSHFTEVLDLIEAASDVLVAAVRAGTVP